MPTSRAAPGDLEVVRGFVNTLDVEEGTDLLESTEGLRHWLDAQREALERLGASGPDAASSGELDLAVRTRTGLRALIAANDHPLVDEEAVHHLDEVADAVRLAPRFAPDGTRLVPRSHGVAQVLGVLLGVVVSAMADGEWRRLKLCDDDGCAWAYYDSSRNRSRRWCSMEVCGNRAKVRAFRERREHDPDPA